MPGNRKVTGRSSSIPAGLAAGGLVSAAATTVITAFLAGLLAKENMSWNNIGYGIATMILLSAFLGAVTAWKRIRRQKLIICMMSGMIYLAMLLSVTALFFGGRFEAVGVTVLLIAGGCFCAALTGTGQGGRRNRGLGRK